MTTEKYKDRNYPVKKEISTIEKYRNIIDSADVLEASSTQLKLYDKANEGTKRVLAEKGIVEREFQRKVIEVMDVALTRTLTDLTVCKELNEGYANKIKEYDNKITEAGKIDNDLINKFTLNDSRYIIRTPTDPEVAELKLQLIKDTYFNLKNKQEQIK